MPNTASRSQTTDALRVFCLIILIADLTAWKTFGGVLVDFFTSGPFAGPADLICFVNNADRALRHVPVTTLSSPAACNFMYPPPFLLAAAPFSFLSPLLAFFTWTAASLIAVIAAARAVKLSWRVTGLGLASPATLMCLICGQNGCFTAALLLLSLCLAAPAPVLAGIAAGCLIIKPQFGLLLPVCYLASRNMRAIAAATATALALCAASLAVFGTGIWHNFLFVNSGDAVSELNMPPGDGFQHIMITVFVCLRSLHAGLSLAYDVQAVVTAAAIGITFWLWRPARQIAPELRLALTVCLVMLATPFAYVYDLPVMGLVLTRYALSGSGRQDYLPAAGFYLVTGLYVILSQTGFSSGGLFLLLLLGYLIRQVRTAGLAGALMEG